MEDNLHITIDDILDDLRNASTQDVVDGYTAAQISELLNFGEKKTAKMLRRLVKSGRIKCTRVKITDIAGRDNYTYVYHP